MIIGICGAGTMGRGIAIASLTAGHGVVIFDISDEALTAARNNPEATSAMDGPNSSTISDR